MRCFSTRVPYNVLVASLIEDLSNCKVAIGIQSYALYISALLGIKTYSIGKTLGIEVNLPSVIEVI